MRCSRPKPPIMLHTATGQISTPSPPAGGRCSVTSKRTTKRTKPLFSSLPRYSHASPPPALALEEPKGLGLPFQLGRQPSIPTNLVRLRLCLCSESRSRHGGHSTQFDSERTNDPGPFFKKASPTCKRRGRPPAQARERKGLEIPTQQACEPHRLSGDP